MSLQQNTENQNLNDTNTNTNTNNTEPRVFTEDYVKALRSEAAENRVKAKNFEKKLKTVLGINEDEAIENWDTVITSYQTNLQERLEKAKELLFQAELKEKKLKTVLGINEDEAIENWDTVITSYQTNLQEQLGKVKELLFQAELKKYEGQYNMKLVNKLLDKSKIQIDDNGNITGLQETLKELEKDFPEVIKNNNNNGGANPILDNQKQKSTNVFDLITKIKTRK